MGLLENYALYKGMIEGFMDVDLDYKSPRFPGNRHATCAAQALYWFMDLAGQIKVGTGLKEPLLTVGERSTALQFGPLENGTKLNEIASKTVDLRGISSAENIKEMTPWRGTYKAYGIGSNKGDGHIIGAYFPWTGRVKFYDPNLVVGTCKEDANVYELLKIWPHLYQGCDTPDALWGHETLFVFDDPAAAIKKLNG
ncbi:MULTISPECIES: hypothetical protein [unclassified Sphingomonas]|jgi:hypothetical protein|uniref:hypothetical protein n=1 Tax=unclassified Sphingomonas TaxID=196159 RepID=UPI00082E4AE0|nr:MULTISPECIES: hypothetical protein [unclassified Sphingomonas]